ncbi:hypothetical protein HerbRD11066_37500 [Herbidospora sp. RD11066]
MVWVFALVAAAGVAIRVLAARAATAVAMSGRVIRFFPRGWSVVRFVVRRVRLAEDGASSNAFVP